MKTATLACSALLLALTGCDRIKQAATPTTTQQVDYFVKKRECYELASQRQAREQNARGKPGLNDRLIYLDSEQCYVPSMNTCICESGFIVVRDGKAAMSLTDLLTGHDLTSGNSDDPKYKKERDRLFALCAK